jgi:hypothetical protein
MDIGSFLIVCSDGNNLETNQGNSRAEMRRNKGHFREAAAGFPYVEF